MQEIIILSSLFSGIACHLLQEPLLQDGNPRISNSNLRLYLQEFLLLLTQMELQMAHQGTFWLHSIVYFNSKFKWLSINDANPFRGRGILGCFIKKKFLFSNLYLLYCEQYGKIFTHTKNQLKILKNKYSPWRLKFIVLS